MKHISKAGFCRPLPLTVLTATLCVQGMVYAGDAEPSNDITVDWALTASYSSAWRTTDPNLRFVGPGDGGSADGYGNGAVLNYRKGMPYSRIVKILGELDIHNDTTGLFLRGKAWNDLQLTQGTVPYGMDSNAYAPNTSLSDDGFDTRLSKFKGVVLLDAYGYLAFDVASNPVKIKLGQHTVNWGEALFVPGVNQYSVFDVHALNQPGTQIKEALLPVPQASINIGLPSGGALEAFYQTAWRKDVFDGCGTFWSVTNIVNCGTPQTNLNNDGVTAAYGIAPLAASATFNGAPELGGANMNLAIGAEKKPHNARQYGVSYKQNIEAVDTELGAYFVQYATHTPILSVKRDAGTTASSVYADFGSLFWDYSAQNIQVLGTSASTVIAGWAVAGELSHTRNFPVQLNVVDGFNALAGLGGPQESRAPAPLSGETLTGYDLKHRNQIQISTLKIFDNVLGASNITFLAEIAAQRWGGIGDPYTSVRYGRGFDNGSAPHSSTPGVPCTLINPENCTQAGYFTPSAWGYRAMAELNYPNLFGNIGVKPHLFFSHDVKGYSADYIFVQDRQAITLGTKFEYLKRYSLDVAYTRFNHHAFFDATNDRDNISMSLAASF